MFKFSRGKVVKESETLVLIFSSELYKLRYEFLVCLWFVDILASYVGISGSLPFTL